MRNSTAPMANFENINNVESGSVIKQRRYKKRHSRCYELSLEIQLDNPDYILVHGTLHSANLPTTPYLHAWLEFGTNVFDAVLNKNFRKDDFYTKFCARESARYSIKQTAEKMLSTGHCGPWE